MNINSIFNLEKYKANMKKNKTIKISDENIKTLLNFNTEVQLINFTNPSINLEGIDEIKKMLEIEVWEGSFLSDSEILTAWAENQSQIETLNAFQLEIERTIKVLQQGRKSSLNFNKVFTGEEL